MQRLGRRDIGGFRCGRHRSPTQSGAAERARRRGSGERVVVAAVALLLAASGRPTPALEHTEAAALLSSTKAGVTEGRSQFREIYCAVRRDHGAALPYDRPCEDSAALWRLPGEPPPTGRPVRFYSLAAGRQNVSVLLAPFWLSLAKIDPANDGLVVASDAIVPGSALLGYPNADHLAVAMPFPASPRKVAAWPLTSISWPETLRGRAPVSRRLAVNRRGL